jgi:hypothetical protein
MSPLAAFVREHSEIRRQIHRTLWDRGLRPGDGEYERQAERLGMPKELDLKAFMDIHALLRAAKQTSP